jgi:hypothetical protein
VATIPHPDLGDHRLHHLKGSETLVPRTIALNPKHAP